MLDLIALRWSCYEADCDKRGWSIFECPGSDHAPYELQRLDDDDEPRFADDVAAWQAVNYGSAIHDEACVAAVAFLFAFSPEEYDRVRDAGLPELTRHEQILVEVADRRDELDLCSTCDAWGYLTDDEAGAPIDTCLTCHGTGSEPS
jgi:hypothetical protein